MDTPFGHPYKKIDTPMSLPIEKEHHMQILVRFGPTVWPATQLKTERQTFAYTYVYKSILYCYGNSIILRNKFVAAIIYETHSRRDPSTPSWA